MASQLAAAEVDLTPLSLADGQFTEVTVAGRTAWQNTGTSRYLYVRRPDSFDFTPGQTLYVRVTYFDGDGGRMIVQYDSQSHAYTVSPFHSRTSRVGTGEFVHGYFELPDVLFDKRQNGSTDFRVNCAAPGGERTPVKRITLSDTPFDDPDFQLVISRPWQHRHTGPAKDYVDNSTLKGKVMTGYQAWFRTPNDLADRGWVHWVRNNTMTPENFTIDAWPDLREYDPAALVRARNITTQSGAPTYLFSSTSYSVIHQQLRWMRKHNLDGLWLQRFHPQAGASSEWPLRHVSQAAAEEGLVWGLMYDVSGMDDTTVAEKLQADWEWQVEQFDILNDPRYIHEGGQPVVFIWGLAVPNRNFTPASADAVVDYFKGQGLHVLGGLPTNWHTLNQAWQDHMAKYDGVLVWMNQNPAHAEIFRSRGQDFYPHIWPGFSWAHLMNLPATPLAQYTDRESGQFYWNKGWEWINAGGADRLYIGMWDEYDECTHFIPMSDDPPPPHTEWGRFIDNQGKPGDWWMMLTGELKRMMLGQRPLTSTMPTVESLANRSNIGAEAIIRLGATDIEDSLSLVDGPGIGDGGTVVESVGGRECRANAEPTATHRFMYFNVDDGFAHQLEDGNVTIEVEYFDNSMNTVLGLQYDGATGPHTNHPQSITTTGSATWRRVRFEIADTWFGGRQNGGADFRLNFNGKKLHVSRVWVRLPEGKMWPFTWTNATPGPAHNWSSNGNWLGGIVGQSHHTSIVRILPDQALHGGTIPISNDITGLQLGTLHLGGTSSPEADTIVRLLGNAIAIGGAEPVIVMDATTGTSYEIKIPLTLDGTLDFSGVGDASLRIAGPVTGADGLVKSSPGALTLAAANTYAGPTSVEHGVLQIAHGGTLETASLSISEAAMLDVAGGTLILAGDATAHIATLAAEGRIIAMDGNATLNTSYDTIHPGQTTVTATLPAPETTRWSSPDPGTWTTGTRWTGGAAPLDASQHLRVVFNTVGAGPCLLDVPATVAHLVMGDNTAAHDHLLILAPGAELTTGLDSFGRTTWTGIGYNRGASMRVRHGAILRTKDHLWIGFSSPAIGNIEINGGTIDVAGQFGLGWNGGEGHVIIRNGGALVLDRIDPTRTVSGNSSIDIRTGSIVIGGNRLAAIQAYIDDGKLLSYGGDGTVLASHNVETNLTTITSAGPPTGYHAWADGWDEIVGGPGDDPDGDGRSNLYEYALNGDPTDATDMGGTPPRFDMTDGTLHFRHLARKGDPGLLYTVQSSTDLSPASWIDADLGAAEVVPYNDNYDEFIHPVDGGGGAKFYRLKISGP